MNPQVLRRVEWITAILLSCVFLFLLTTRARHAGPLWRDEAATVQLSQAPTVQGVWENFQRESFPAPLPLLVRGYTALFGTNDGAFRAFGFAVGALLLGVMWLNARITSRDLPLLAILLLGFNTSFLVWGTGIRGYGIGSVIILAAFGLIGALLVRFSAALFVAALIASLLSVQVLLYNSVLVCALTLAAVGIALARRQFASAAGFVPIALACAISMLPYVGPFHYESQSTVVLQGESGLGWFFQQFGITLGKPGPVMVALWSLLLLGLAAVAIRQLFSRALDRTNESPLYVYALLATALSFVLYFGFLVYVNYRTREWYYLALVSVLAGAIDLLGALLARQRQWIRLGRLGVAVMGLVALPVFAWPRVVERQSNVDLIAKKLEQEAGPNDLIICNPWYLGVSFGWYYHGRTPWTTWPDLEDVRFHRFDLIKNRMMSSTPLFDVQQRVAETLRSNHRVWIVGEAVFPKEGQEPFVLPPAPHSPVGWLIDAYVDSWSEALGAMLQNHARTGGYADTPAAGPVNELENVPLIFAQGWRE